VRRDATVYARSRTPRLQWLVAAACRATACKGNGTGHQSPRLMRAKHVLDSPKRHKATNNRCTESSEGRKPGCTMHTSMHAARGRVGVITMPALPEGKRTTRRASGGEERRTVEKAASSWLAAAGPPTRGGQEPVRTRQRTGIKRSVYALMRCQSDCCQGDQYKHPSHFMRRTALSIGRVVRSTSLISVARTLHVGARKGRGVRGALGVTHVDG
jgi:hypothetical protein